MSVMVRTGTEVIFLQMHPRAPADSAIAPVATGIEMSSLAMCIVIACLRTIDSVRIRISI